MELSKTCMLLCIISACSASPTRPVIGVLTVPLSEGCETMMGKVAAETSPSVKAIQDQGGSSCFTTFYAKWIESGGAQIAIIPYDATPEKVDAMLGAVDGLLFTGGGLSLELNTTYDITANRIFQYAKTHRITLWGTCMGFQLLNVLAAKDRDVLTRYAFDSEKISMALKFTDAAPSSKFFSNAPSEVYKILGTENVTMNFHHDGITPATFASTPSLNEFYNVLSTNVDRVGKEFISTIEAKDKNLSIFGVQWHPERPQFEWTPNEDISHTADAIEANSWAARFLINSARSTLPTGTIDPTWYIYNHTIIDPHADSYMWYVFGPDGAKLR